MYEAVIAPRADVSRFFLNIYMKYIKLSTHTRQKRVQMGATTANVCVCVYID